MAKKYTSYKQFLNKNIEQRQACLKFWNEERLANLTINLIDDLENQLRQRTELDKRNIITGIDFFNGAYIYISFCNSQTVGNRFLNETKELLKECNIPFEISGNGQCSLFIEKDDFLLKYVTL